MRRGWSWPQAVFGKGRRPGGTLLPASPMPWSASPPGFCSRPIARPPAWHRLRLPRGAAGTPPRVRAEPRGMATAQPGRPPVLIVGATGGIGSALAPMLAADGVPLALVARDCSRLRELGREFGAPVWTCDVMETDLLADAGRAACADGVSGLAYCVGSIVLGSLRTARAETFIEVFKRDVVGAFTAVQAAQDALMHASGSVVLFSSVAARQGI
ncbi:MAG: SDR family oxidoreductase, partial [Acidimicrobiia bacterium]|nr:SDR family oxidoreductase [Acidimicrobiia bacterium]